MTDGVHDHAGVVRCCQSAQSDLAGLRIDGHLCNLRGKRGHRRMIVVLIDRLCRDRPAGSRQQLGPDLLFPGLFVDDLFPAEHCVVLRPAQHPFRKP